MTEKIIELREGVSLRLYKLASFIFSVYWRYMVVDRFMRRKDPKAKDMEVLGVIAILIGLTQLFMLIIAVVGSSVIGGILSIILITEFILGFLFILRKCGSITYSIIVNLPGLKILVIVKKIAQARFPYFYILVKDLITGTLKNSN